MYLIKVVLGGLQLTEVIVMETAVRGKPRPNLVESGLIILSSTSENPLIGIAADFLFWLLRNIGRRGNNCCAVTFTTFLSFN